MLELRENPVGAWTLDAINPLVDISGYGNDGSYTGTLINDLPVRSRSVGSVFVNSGITISLPVPKLMLTGRENKPFSLSMWIRPYETGATATMFSRNAAGFALDGDILSFFVSMDETKTAKYYGIKPGKNYHVVGVYDTTSISLYVNGNLVATQEIFSDSISAGFVSDSDSLCKFTASSGSSYSLDSVAVDATPLSRSSVARLYNDGTNYPDTSNHNYVHYQFSDQHMTVPLQFVVETDSGWAQGITSDNVFYDDDIIYNEFDGANYLSGTWTTIFRVPPVAKIYQGSRISWDANSKDLTVEVSLDGTNYTAVTNNSAPFGSLNAVAGNDISVRVTFPQATSQTTLQRLSFVLYDNKIVEGSDASLGATISDPAIVAEFDSEPTSFVGNMGALLAGGAASIKIPGTTTFGNYTAAEFIFRFDSVTNNKRLFEKGTATVDVNGSGQLAFTNITNAVINGVSVSTASPYAIKAGVWYHIVMIFASNPNDIYIANNSAGSSGLPVRIGYAAAHYSITTDQATDLFNYLVGGYSHRVDDTDVFTITDGTYSQTNSAAYPYSLNWTVVKN
jgi:hypothetical protein